MHRDELGEKRYRDTAVRVVSAAVLCAAIGLLAGCSSDDAPPPSSEAAPIAPLSSSGRWLTDASGRVVTLHGVNMVEKSAPYYPAAVGFGEDDVAFLAAEGFNALRLGVDCRGLIPQPGVIEDAYIEALAETVEQLSEHEIFTLIDFHQDGFSPMFNGNGLPDWMAITDGLPNPPDAVFPFYYIQNPAMQRAFEHFWDDSPGPGGIGLQDYFIEALERVVARFADNPWVIGTEVINEPFPGADWQPCLTNPAGCPDLERDRLMPFYARAGEAARRQAPSQLVFVEPFVLFNFGNGPTSLPGSASDNALAVHSYPVSMSNEAKVVEHAVDAAERDGAAVLMTEFGATNDPIALTRLAAGFDEERLSWLFWAYNENIMDPRLTASAETVRHPEVVDALVRPYPLAVAGTPTKIEYDPTSKEFELEYDTRRPDGAPSAAGLVTSVFIPARHYPDGYTVVADGAAVESTPNATTLVLRSAAGVEAVSVRVSPAG